MAHTKGIVLTHGAGGNARSELLIVVAEEFHRLGWRTHCYDLPFRQKRSFGPPSPKGAEEDRAGLRAAVTEMRRDGIGEVWLGGHSYGGRQASILASEDPQLVAGLVLLSYPLHPPKKPDQLRTAHFPALRTRSLFIHGTRDDFATEAELRQAIVAIPAKTQLYFVEGAGHELNKGAFDLQCLHDFCDRIV